MKELEKNINKLEKEVKKITHSKQKKHMSPETMQYFSDVLNGIDELNRDVLGYKGTNIYLLSKLVDSVPGSYVQY